MDLIRSPNQGELSQDCSQLFHLRRCSRLLREQSCHPGFKAQGATQDHRHSRCRAVPSPAQSLSRFDSPGYGHRHVRRSAHLWIMRLLECDRSPAVALSRWRQRRPRLPRAQLVSISENLRSWLVPFARESGPVSPLPATYQWHFRKAACAAGLSPWPHNALRHSFASYLLADNQDAAKVALQLGHTESRTLFAHYRELVTPEAAKAFWQAFAA